MWVIPYNNVIKRCVCSFLYKIHFFSEAISHELLKLTSEAKKQTKLLKRQAASSGIPVPQEDKTSLVSRFVRWYADEF